MQVIQPGRTRGEVDVGEVVVIDVTDAQYQSTGEKRFSGHDCYWTTEP